MKGRPPGRPFICPDGRGCGGVTLRAVHLRPPSFDHGFTSGLWAIGLGLFILLGSISVGLDKGTAFVISPLAAIAIYLLVRTRGREDVRG